MVPDCWTSVSFACALAPDGAGRTRPAGRRRPQTATNLRDVVVLARAVAIGDLVTTGAQRIENLGGDASHLSSNSAAANPPTAAVRLSCDGRLRPDQWNAASLIVGGASQSTAVSASGSMICPIASGRRRSLQERRTAAVGGLAAAEFDDRCDASPRQISTRCAPVVGLVPMARVIASTTTSQRFVAV
jgi:hypothetical protein